MNTPATAARNIFWERIRFIGSNRITIFYGFFTTTKLHLRISDCISTNSFGWLIPSFSIIFLFLAVLIRQKPEFLRIFSQT